MAVAVFLCLQARYGANAPPTVIFVVVDTLRADRTSLCGYAHPTTPKLEALVERGASYACNSHAPSTWTLPSHATFFTGLGSEDHQSGSGGNTKGMTWGSVTRSYPEMHDHRLADRLKLILQYLALDPDRPLFAFINIAVHSIEPMPRALSPMRSSVKSSAHSSKPLATYAMTMNRRRRSLPTPISAETASADLGRDHHRSIDDLLAKSLARSTM